MATINERIKELNEQHFLGCTEYSYGGLCDEENYAKTKCKTLFLLKEMNIENGVQIVSLPDLLKRQATDLDYAFYTMWRNVARWIRIIENPDISYDEVEKQGITWLRKALKSTGAINIKKKHGKGESNHEEILACSMDTGNQALIKEEIKISGPKLVICGGTFYYAQRIYQRENTESPVMSTGTKYFTDNGTCFVEFVHPAIRADTRIVFAYFKEMYHAFCNEIIWR